MNEHELFAAALEFDTPDERGAYLDRACGGDDLLRARVAALLRAHQQAGSFLAAPPVGSSATLEAPGPPEGPGTVIGPYKLLQTIGEGGMGTVYMAEQERPVRRLVALKVIKAGMDTRQVLARFDAERQALALMDHPNIARVLDAGATEAGRPYFVMELVKGVPITRYCDDRRLTLKERLELFVPVCQAVQHAHQKGVIHRDLKPSNILVAQYDGRPVPKVIDFGVAKATGPRLTEQTLYTEFGAVVGTLEYMSPEQAELNQLDIDTRSDVYSLGAILYELLTGSTPLGRERLRTAALVEMLRIIREEDCPRPSTRVSTTEELPTIAACRQVEPRKLGALVRGELDWIVMKALEKDRNRRYETANDFALDVQRYLADEPVQACPPSAAYRFRKVARRHKGALASAAAILVVLLTATAVSAWQALRATRAERKTRDALAQMTAAQAQTRQALDTLFDNVVETMFAKQPKLDEAEKACLQKVAGLYEDLGRQSGEAAEARFLRAEGAFKVAHLRGLLGQQAEAAAGYGVAEALLEQLASEFPGIPDYRAKLARVEDNLGIRLAELGKEVESEAAFRRGIALRTKLADDFPQDPRYRLELANNYGDLGRLREWQHRIAEAEAAYRRALDIKEQLAAGPGAAPMYHQELARGRARLGSTLRMQEKYAEAETLYRRALDAQQSQGDEVPATPRDRDGLASTYHGLGIVLAELRREAEAEVAFRRAVDVRKRLADDFPKALEYRRHLATAYSDLGYFLRRQGKDAESEGPYRQALDLRKKLIAEGGAAPRYLQELAGSHDNLGDVLRVTNRPKEAESAWRDALALWERLAADRPQAPDYQNGLGGTLRNLATLHNQRREFAAAVPLLERARPHFQAALKASPKNPEFRLGYRDHLLTLAQSRLGLADHARLAATADELAGFGYEPAKDTYAAAGMLARCASLAREGPRLDEAKRKELALGYADRALALLRQALDRGFKDAAHMKADPDLEPLRERTEFTKLLAGLDAGSAAARKPTP
jgi:serine/threonine protein kinase/tetratricopeptide (TPR) repeat protein